MRAIIVLMVNEAQLKQSDGVVQTGSARRRAVLARIILIAGILLALMLVLIDFHVLDGFAGVLFALEYASVSVETFEISQSIILFAIVIVGGQGSIVGVLVGTFIMFVVPELIRESAYMAERMGRSIDAGTVSMLMKIRYLIFGFLMVILMIFRPNGLIPVKFGFYPKKFFKGGA